MSSIITVLQRKTIHGIAVERYGMESGEHVFRLPLLSISSQYFCFVCAYLTIAFLPCIYVTFFFFLSLLSFLFCLLCYGDVGWQLGIGWLTIFCYSSPARLIELFNRRSYLEQTRIGDLVIMPAKEARERLYRLYQLVLESRVCLFVCYAVLSFFSYSI